MARILLSLGSFLFFFAPLALCQTMQSDKDALLAFKSEVQDNGLVLAGWTNDTDPCIDKWTGVSCTCYPFYEEYGSSRRIPACNPIDPGYYTSGSRVLQLNLGDVRITDWNVLGGNLPEAVGNLTALRILNLKGNNFTGPIPSQWSRLRNLEQLILSDNNITGPLPIYFEQFTRLKYVYLDNNNITGNIPVEWCYGGWWIFDVRNNPGLCDEVPSCLYERIVAFEGTSLIDTIASRDNGQGGYCDVEPPTCRRSEDACWLQLPNPAFWIDPARVTFSFPTFPSIEGGTPAVYAWRIGTEPGGGNIADWTSFEGRNVTQSAGVQQSDSDETMVVTQVVHLTNATLPNGIALRQGDQYYVSVRGSNSGGPRQGVVITAGPVTVDSTPPYLPSGAGVYSGQYYSNVPAQLNTNGIGVSWDEFLDPESGVKQYSYQVFQYISDEPGSENGIHDHTGPAQNTKVKLKDTSSRDVYITQLDLLPGNSYFVRVFAMNNAGLETHIDAPPVAVVNPGEGYVVTNNTIGLAASNVAIIVAALVGFTSAVVAVITFYLARERYSKRQQASRKHRGQMRSLRHLLNTLVERVGDTEKGQLEELRQLKNVAFVITDLENSTRIASAAPRAYEWAQEAHDSLLRDLIVAHGGYEINTEGDAFHVAFKDVATAVHFCMEVQYQMMDVEWPREVLRLQECKEVRAPDGNWTYRGPRIRMGIHWAEEGSVVQHIHQLTKHRVFTGPAFQITRDLCESASGGQVLMSHAVWERLRANMPSASFPVVEQLGAYRFPGWPDPLWVYQVTQLLGKPLQRPVTVGGPLAGADLVSEGAGLGIVPVPTPRTSRGELAFVSCRLAVEDCPAGVSGVALPYSFHIQLYEVLSTAAMQYGGYVFRLSESQGCYLLAFVTTVDAVRFCHTAQVLLMYSPWQQESKDWLGKEEKNGIDGKLLFKGPRVAMAIHLCNDYSSRPVPRTIPSPDASTTLADYVGPAEESVRVLSEVAHGGQVVLSEAAWGAVQDQLPGGPQVISLGVLAIDDPCFASAIMLMEVMPQVLCKRSFSTPRRARTVEPGYRDAPSAKSDVAIVQMRVHKPTVVTDAEAAAASLSDEAILRVITAYNVALARVVKLARDLLRTHGGYECKEPEPGKLNVAFTTLESAVRWSSALHRHLIDVHWPKELLTWDECAEEGEEEEEDVAEAAMDGVGDEEGENLGAVGGRSANHSVLVGVDAAGRGSAAASTTDGGSLLWKGLRVRIGIACGVPMSKAPLNTGRADYFGTIPNLAARLMSMASPGQTLLDAAKISTLRSLQWRDDAALLPGNAIMQEGIELLPLGQFAVKGLEELRTVFQALPVSLQARAFEECSAVVRPMALSLSRRIASLRRPSEPFTGVGGGGSQHHSTGADAPSTGTAGQVEVASPRVASSLRRPRIFSSISRNGSVTSGGQALTSSRRGGTILRTTSRMSDSSAEGTGTVKPSLLRPSMFSASETSSVGGGTFSWFARSQAKDGVGAFINETTTTPKAGSGTHIVNLPASSSTNTTPKSMQRTVSAAVPIRASSFSDVTGPLSAEVLSEQVIPETGYPHSPSHHALLGSYHSDSAAAAHAAVGSANPQQQQQQHGPYASLRDVSDWSYPGSRAQTPNALTKVVDHWDAGLAMEAALKVDAFKAHRGAYENSRMQQVPILDAAMDSPSGASATLSFAEQGMTWRDAGSSAPVAVDGGGTDGAQGQTAGGAAALQYARQIAQLFVDRRKNSLEKKTSNLGVQGSPTKSWLANKLSRSSKEVTPAASPVKGSRSQL